METLQHIETLQSIIDRNLQISTSATEKFEALQEKKGTARAVMAYAEDVAREHHYNEDIEYLRDKVERAIEFDVPLGEIIEIIDEQMQTLWDALAEFDDYPREKRQARRAVVRAVGDLYVEFSLHLDRHGNYVSN